MPDFKVSVDPGKWGCGVAIWRPSYDKYVLDWAGYVKNATAPCERAKIWANMARNVYISIDTKLPQPRWRHQYSLILEIPQVYKDENEKDKNDLLDLAGVQGGIAAVTGMPVDWSPLPREWKGQVPKDVSEKRVESKLSESEKKVIEWPGKKLDHNVYDALHLGLVYLEKNNLR